MQKSIYFAVMAFVVVAILVGCNKNEEQSEVALTVSEITNSSAVVSCDYSPAKSVSYKLHIGEAASEEYTESMGFMAAGLNGGTKYNVVATTYDVEHKEVGSTVVNFRTTGEPDNQFFEDLTIEPNYVQVQVNDDSAESVTVTCTLNTDDQYYSAFTGYSLSCDNGGVFSETGRFTTSKTLTLSNLQSGTIYDIAATTYIFVGKERSSVSNTKFTKK